MRADNIRPYTSAIYVSRRVFANEQSSPCGVSLAAALQIPIYQSVYTTKVPADITVGTFLFYEYSVKKQRDFFSSFRRFRLRRRAAVSRCLRPRSRATKAPGRAPRSPLPPAASPRACLCPSAYRQSSSPADRREPKNSPGPRNLRSSSAILKPSVVVSMTFIRLCAVSFCASVMRMQVDLYCPRPMRPLS